MVRRCAAVVRLPPRGAVDDEADREADAADLDGAGPLRLPSLWLLTPLEDDDRRFGGMALSGVKTDDVPRPTRTMPYVCHDQGKLPRAERFGRSSAYTAIKRLKLDVVKSSFGSRFELMISTAARRYHLACEW